MRPVVNNASVPPANAPTELRTDPATGVPTRLSPVGDSSIWDSMHRSWVRNLRSKNRGEGTIRTYTQSYRRFVVWALDPDLGGGITDPEDVTRADLESFFAYELTEYVTWKGGRMKASAVAVDFRQLRVFFGWLAAEQDEDDPRNIMRNMSAPEIPKHRVEIFTDDELRALIGACAGTDFTARRDTAMMRLLLDAGLRRAELTGIEVDDVDLDAQTVEVLGKGRGGGKSRTVAYGAKTAEALDRYLRVRAKHKDRNRTQALWLAGYPRRGALGYEGVRQMIERRAADAGLADVFAHKFRHTAAHAALSAGMSEGDAMRQFGWDSRTMVDRYGAAAAQDRANASARRLSVGDRI
jgi:site-specific recombinase XerD